MDLLFFLMALLFPIGFIVMGAAFVIGTKQKWPIFVSPPDDWWCFYSQSFIKRIFGHKGLIVFNYSFGFLSVAVGLIVIFNGVKELLSR